MVRLMSDREFGRLEVLRGRTAGNPRGECGSRSRVGDCFSFAAAGAAWIADYRAERGCPAKPLQLQALDGQTILRVSSRRR